MTELDDAMVPTADGRCICLRCFAHETESDLTMPDHLRGELIAALSATEAG